jgi:hypothetical protein
LKAKFGNPMDDKAKVDNEPLPACLSWYLKQANAL